jgi:hypothetical protein
MAINWGAALGAAVDTGLKTYERLGAEEEREMLRQKMKREMAEQQALDTKFAERMGRVGEQNDYSQALQTADTGISGQQAKMLSDQAAGFGPEGERASAEAAAGALRQNVGVTSALPELKADKYTALQAESDYLKDAAGISRKGYAEALSLKSASRKNRIEEEFDGTNEWRKTTLGMLEGTLETKGMSGIPDKLNPMLSKSGLKAQYVESKKGEAGFVKIVDKEGKTVQTLSSPDAIREAGYAAIQGEWMKRMEGLFGGPTEALSYIQKRQELDLKKEQLGIEKEYKGAGGVIDRAYQTGAKGGRTTKKEVTNADIKSFITEFGDKPSYEKDPKTGKPIAIRDLPLAKQAAYANEFYLGRETDGGLPDIPKGGLNLEKPGAKKSQPASTALPRSFEGQKFGMLTPRSVVLEAAQAGNPDAIAFLEGMEKNRLDQELQRGNLGL